jgi:hypothetical protein
MATSITSADVVSYLGIPTPENGSSDEYVLDLVVSGTNALVPATVPRVRELAAGADWPADVIEGAVMQAARLFTRRRSPGSVSSYSDTTGAATFVARWDPDIERLMHTGMWAPPAFG